MLWLQSLHFFGTFLPWLIVLFVRNPRILLFAIMWNFAITVQWVILGKCILAPIENNGSRYPAFYEWLASYFDIPIREFSKGYMLIMSTAPTFVMAALLSTSLGRGLGLKKIVRRNR